MRAPRVVGILGGMGPAAGAEFARLFVHACGDLLRERGEVVHDQAYPPHWLCQLPVADRTAALVDPRAPQPSEAMASGLRQLAQLGADAVAIACNTAHAWHGHLQAAVPSVRLLHAMDCVADELVARGIDAAGLLATQGTYDSGLYTQALQRRGIACRVPGTADRRLLMDGIYMGVKRGRLDEASLVFQQVAARLAARHGLRCLILGCTEIPLAIGAPPPGLAYLDPAALLARRLAAAAYGQDLASMS